MKPHDLTKARPLGQDGRPRDPLEDPRLEEIRKRVERGYYDGEAVMQEVTEAFVEGANGSRRSAGGPGKRPATPDEPTWQDGRQRPRS